MDKMNLSTLSNMLFDELLIGAALYTASSELTVSALKDTPICGMFPEEYIIQIINDLVSYGLVVPRFNGTANFSFSITDFGTYYFKKLSEENVDFNTIITQIGGELRRKECYSAGWFYPELENQMLFWNSKKGSM